MRRRARAAGLIAAVLALGGQLAVPDPAQYRNVDYQFCVKIPQGSMAA
jgi:hypothetical protein